MKMQKKQLSAAIAFALTLILAATFITALPIAFGQFLPTARESVLLMLVHRRIQWEKVRACSLRAGSIHRRQYLAALYYNLTFTVTKPDGTKFNVTRNTLLLLERQSFNYVPDQVGNYTVVLSFPGDFSRS